MFLIKVKANCVSYLKLIPPSGTSTPSPHFVGSCLGVKQLIFLTKFSVLKIMLFILCPKIAHLVFTPLIATFYICFISVVCLRSDMSDAPISAKKLCAVLFVRLYLLSRRLTGTIKCRMRGIAMLCDNVNGSDLQRLVQCGTSVRRCDKRQRCIKGTVQRFWAESCASDMSDHRNMGNKILQKKP